MAFPKSIMISIGVSKLGKTPIIVREFFESIQEN